MTILRACAVCLLCAAPLFADPGTLPKSSVKAEDKVRVWLDQDPGMRANLAAIQASCDVEFKDAVADQASQDPAQERQDLISRLPGMRAPKVLGCANAADCGAPPLKLDIPMGESVEHAVRAMLRPWLWLAEARKLKVSVTRAEAGDAGQVLVMKLKALGPSGAVLSVSARPEGGACLSFDRAAELAEIYARERAELLAKRD